MCKTDTKPRRRRHYETPHHLTRISLFHYLLSHTLVYGVDLLFLSRLKLFCRPRAGLDDPPERPELPPGPEEPLSPPLPPFLFSLIMSSKDMLILSAIVGFKLLANTEEEQRTFGVETRLFISCSLRYRGVETSGNDANALRK